MEQSMNFFSDDAQPEAAVPAWRSVGSVARQLLARAEMVQSQREADAQPVEFLAWAAE